MGNLLITGGAGFIGSNFVNHRLSKEIMNERIFVIDALTYASNFSYLVKNENLTFIKGDIRDKSLVDRVMSKIDSVVNFAAESHVGLKNTNKIASETLGLPMFKNMSVSDKKKIDSLLRRFYS